VEHSEEISVKSSGKFTKTDHIQRIVKKRDHAIGETRVLPMAPSNGDSTIANGRNIFGLQSIDLSEGG
jgi:hypothetical protein